MGGSDRMALARLAAAPLVVTAMAIAACAGPPPSVPSAVIVPDIVTVRVGESQLFTVYYGNVREFRVLAGQVSGGCVEIEPTPGVANSVRVVARRLCSDLAYLNADIGSGRTPLVAAISVSSQ